MSNFFRRLLTGSFFGVIIFGSLLAGPVAYLICFSTLMVLALFEFYRLADCKEIKVQKISAVIISVLTFFMVYAHTAGFLSHEWLSAIVLVPFIIMIIELYRKKEKPFSNLVWTFFGLIYIVLPFSLINFLVHLSPFSSEFNPSIIMGVFILIMVNDSIAYIVGVNFGRHRLFKSVSPKKSWEGAIGGAVTVIALAYPLSMLFQIASFPTWFFISILVAVFGIYGDLVESLFKRGLGVKDSGRILPGHGGVLDRIDAWLFVIPSVWILLTLLK